MKNSKLVKVIKEGINRDIRQVKLEYDINISPQVGKAIRNFVGYWGSKSQNTESLYEQFCELNKALEETLCRYKIGELFSLHEIQKCGLAICKVLAERKGDDLADLTDYLGNLAIKY